MILDMGEPMRIDDVATQADRAVGQGHPDRLHRAARGREAPRDPDRGAESDGRPVHALITHVDVARCRPTSYGARRETPEPRSSGSRGPVASPGARPLFVGAFAERARHRDVMVGDAVLRILLSSPDVGELEQQYVAPRHAVRLGGAGRPRPDGVRGGGRRARRRGPRGRPLVRHGGPAPGAGLVGRGPGRRRPGLDAHLRRDRQRDPLRRRRAALRRLRRGDRQHEPGPARARRSTDLRGRRPPRPGDRAGGHARQVRRLRRDQPRSRRGRVPRSCATRPSRSVRPTTGAPPARSATPRCCRSTATRS